MSSNIASLQLNAQIMQSALNTSSKINGSKSETENEMVYAKEGDARYDKEMDANEDGTITYDEYIKYCEEHAASTYTDNPGKTVVEKIKDSESNIQSIRPINIGKALSSYSNSGIEFPEPKIKSEA